MAELTRKSWEDWKSWEAREAIMRKLFIVLGSLGLALPAQAIPLLLTLNQVTDLSGLGMSSIGGSAFDASDGRLWVADADTDTNDVFEIDPFSGAVFTSFDASVIPGLDLGPDALALSPTSGNLVLFSSFNESEAGVVTQGGALVGDYALYAHAAGGASFDASNQLFTVDEVNGTLRRLDPTTGAVVTTTPLIGFGGRLMGADFDPFSGSLYAYASDDRQIIEIDVITGLVLSLTDVSSFVAPGFPSSLAFNGDGSLVFLSSGTSSSPDELVILNRFVIPEPASLPLLCLGLAGLSGWRKARARLIRASQG